MTTLVSTAFWQRLQGDNVELADLIDLELPNGVAYHWTSANQDITYTLSGAATKYNPFPGNGGGDFQEGIELAVQVMNFTIANTGPVLQGQLLSQDFAQAKVKIGQIFIDTPDLGRMPIYTGKMSDFGYNRQEITGQARNLWKSLNIQWPYYSFADGCSWRFGSIGCGVNVASITVAVPSVDIAGSTVLNIHVASGMISASYDAGRFDFGRITITAGTNSGCIRPVMTQSGDYFQLGYPLPNPDLTGITLSIRPGCKKRLIQDCKSLYNNDVNYLGWPWMPKMTDAY